jgi:hypothetical protein
MKLFRLIAQEIPGCIFIAGGLDECVEPDTSGDECKATFLEQLWNTSAGTACRIVISSRDNPTIRSYTQPIYMGRCQLIQHDILPEDTKYDISQFARTIVDKKLKVNKDTLMDELIEEATK